MGADLITECLWSETGRHLDWEAGLQAARDLPDDACERLNSHMGIWEDDDPAPAAARVRATTRVEEVRRHFEGFTRELVSFATPDGKLTCFLTGGMSWGDSPTDLFDALCDLWAVPEVLTAIGFITTGTEEMA